MKNTCYQKGLQILASKLKRCVAGVLNIHPAWLVFRRGCGAGATDHECAVMSGDWNLEDYQRFVARHDLGPAQNRTDPTKADK